MEQADSTQTYFVGVSSPPHISDSEAPCPLSHPTVISYFHKGRPSHIDDVNIDSLQLKLNHFVEHVSQVTAVALFSSRLDRLQLDYDPFKEMQEFGLSDDVIALLKHFQVESWHHYDITHVSLPQDHVLHSCILIPLNCQKLSSIIGHLCLFHTQPLSLLPHHQWLTFHNLLLQGSRLLCEKRAFHSETQSNHFLQEILHSVPVGIFRVDTEARIVFANQAMRTIFGLPMSSFLDSSWFSTIEVGDRINLLERLRDAISHHHSFQTECRFLYQNKQIRRILFKANPIYNDEAKSCTVDTPLIGTCIDISDQHITTQSSQQEKTEFEKLSIALSKITVGIWDYDMIHDRVYWDHSSCRLHGVSWSEPKTYKTWEDRVHPDDREKAVADLHDICFNSKDVPLSYRIVRPDGTVVHVRSKACMEYNSQGKPVRMLGLNWDVTSEELLKLQLQMKNQKLEAIFTSMKEGIIVHERDGNVSDCNPAAIRILGMENLQELKTKDVLDWEFYREDGSRLLKHDHPAIKSLQTGQPTVDVIASLKRPDGKLKWLKMNATPLFDHNSEVAEQVLCTFADITESKKNERELEGKEAELSSVLDGMPAMIAHYNQDCINLHANKAYAQFLGQTSSAALKGQSMDKIMPASDYKLRIPYIQKVLQGDYQKFELQVRGENDLVRYLLLQYVPDIKEAQVHGFFVITTDVTEFRLLEKELMAAQEAEKKANAAKSSFLASMSHELRTPLNGIIGLTGLLADTTLNEEQRDYVETISSSGNILLSIINDILDFSKIEAGKMELEPCDFKLDAVIKETCRSFQYSAQKKSIGFELIMGDTVECVLVGDCGRFKQVLYNLLGNAIKFTSRGKVTVKASSQLKDAHTAQVNIDVVDTGIGIPKKSWPLIFQSFSQVHSSDRKNISGTGLGLSISKRLVELMGGTIEFDSKEGQGSRFSFQLYLKTKPTSDIPSDAVQSTLATETPHFPLRILIAEDNPTNQKVISRLLEKRGCSFVMADTGRHVVDILQQDSQFDVILMDCQMPEMDGYEATRIIRSSTVCPTIPIVAITANAIQGDKQKCLDCGMNDYISKPIRPLKLDAILAKYTS